MVFLAKACINVLNKDILDKVKAPKILGQYIFQSRFGMHCKVICVNFEQYISMLPGAALINTILQNIQYHLPIPMPILVEIIYDTAQNPNYNKPTGLLGHLGQTSTIGNNAVLHSTCLYDINHDIFIHDK